MPEKYLWVNETAKKWGIRIYGEYEYRTAEVCTESMKKPARILLGFATMSIEEIREASSVLKKNVFRKIN